MLGIRNEWDVLFLRLIVTGGDRYLNRELYFSVLSITGILGGIF